MDRMSGTSDPSFVESFNAALDKLFAGEMELEITAPEGSTGLLRVASVGGRAAILCAWQVTKPTKKDREFVSELIRQIARYRGLRCVKEATTTLAEAETDIRRMLGGGVG